MSPLTPQEPREHELKTWTDYYERLVDGTKTFEYRRDDRGFRVGDVLHLREWEPTFERYTGREMRRTVTYILPVSAEFVVMALAASPSAGASAPAPLNDRLFDLVRYMRADLLDAGLITREEYTKLLVDGSKAGSVARLESYDAMRKRLDELEQAAAPASAPPDGIAAVFSAPMAAGLLLKLKEECQAQHARAEALSSQLDAAQKERDASVRQLEETMIARHDMLKRAEAAEAKLTAFQRQEAALRALIQEPHYQGAPLLAGQRDTSVAMVSAEWYGRLRAALASPDLEKEPTP